MAVSSVGCEQFTTCEETRTCPAQGGSSNDGSGSTSDGGTGTGAGATSTACDPECGGETPACDDRNNQCVGCLQDDDCDAGRCDKTKNECAGCLEDSHCTADAPVCSGAMCVGCSENADCEGYSDTPACNTESGACVECVTEDDCGGKVCDPATNTCTEIGANSAGQCEECVHDAQCQDGQLCVEQEFEGSVVGNFCLWTKIALVGDDGSCFMDGVPFAAATPEPVASVDGQSAILCVLRETTCPGLLDYSKPDKCTGIGDDASCGASGFDDAECRLNSDSDALCTYSCSHNNDCPGNCNGAPLGYCDI